MEVEPTLIEPTPWEYAQALVDPVFFVEHVLGRRLWAKPIEILKALSKPHASIAIKGCHRSSKTWTLGQAVCWFVYCGGRVITTAPTGDQVELLWAEIRAAYAAADKRGLNLGGEMLTHEWKDGKEILAIGRSTDKSERFHGWNYPRVLVVGDEGPGIREEIFEGIEGIRSGGDVRVVLLGNPTRMGGTYYEAFHRNQSTWTTFTVSFRQACMNLGVAIL